MLDEDVEQTLNDESATTRAVRSLIEVKDKKTGKNSDVELKTDLSLDEIKLHTILDVLSNILEMGETDFSKKCVLSSIIEKKERKSLSKDRQSRSEIVNVARQPDMFMTDGMKQESMVKRFFTSRKHEVQ